MNGHRLGGIIDAAEKLTGCAIEQAHCQRIGSVPEASTTTFVLLRWSGRK
jgi:hypothetical protein